MDIDELIRTELTAQADRAPDAEVVLAGVPARARSRRRRRRQIMVPVAAAAVLLAAGIPYAVLRSDPVTAPEPPAATATATPTVGEESLPLKIEPGWLPAGWREWGRQSSPFMVQRDYGNAVNADSSRSYLRLTSQQPAYQRTTAAERVQVAGRPAFWYSDQPTFSRLGYGQAELVLRRSEGDWLTVGVQWRNAAERKTLAIRLAAAVRPSRDTVASTVRVGWLPAGVDRRTAEVTIHGLTPRGTGWLSSVRFAGRVGEVHVSRSLMPPEEGGVLGPSAGSPVTVGGRRAYYRPGNAGPGSFSYLAMMLPDGTMLGIAAVATKAELVRIAASVVAVPGEPGWLPR